MPVLIFIISRIVIITCLVLILGYVFGNFSTKPLLATLTKIASIVIVVGFIVGSVFILRFRNANPTREFNDRWCGYQHLQTDSTKIK